MRLLLCFLMMLSSAPAETLTLPLEKRPGWLAQEGIVMAGSWEPLLFRVRRDGSPGYEPTSEQRRGYEREHSQEMVEELKTLGVNFVMMHCYKGMGVSAERESMQDAVKFSELCHNSGLHVGVYCFSGTLGWELLYKDRPEAANWVSLNAQHKPVTYGRAAYRYYFDRNNPDAQAFHHELIRFAVEEIKTDLLHFDNYIVGPGTEPNSLRRFRQYLTARFTQAQREKMGAGQLDSIALPLSENADPLLRFAWQDFCSQSLADAYYDSGRYARSLRKDVLLEMNPGGPGERFRLPVDHGRLLTGGEAFWDEGEHPGFENGKLRTRIRTYKVARRAGNIAFAYTTNALEAAEAMAFNLNCLGCICWFEYGRIVNMPASNEPVARELIPFIKLFHQRRDLFREGTVVADVAVLRSFPSQVFANAGSTFRAEQELIENRIPFQIIYDTQLDHLEAYQALLLPDCVALSDEHIEMIERFTQRGGYLHVLGTAGTHDEWMRPRKQPAFQKIPPGHLMHLSLDGGMINTLRNALPDGPSLDMAAPAGVCAELIQQQNRYLLHVVNYRPSKVANLSVIMRVPDPDSVTKVSLTSPDEPNGTDISFTREKGRILFTIPSVEVYTVAVVKMK